MERTTTQLTTTGGHDIVLHNYLTGREAQEIAAVAERKEEGKSTYDLQIAANNMAFKKAIVSFDGETDPDKILDAVLDLPIAEFTELSAHLTALIDPKKK